MRLAVPESTDLAAWCELVFRTGLARYAEVSTYGVFLASPDDPRYPDQWSLNNTGQGSGGVPGADVDAERLWDITAGSPSIIVAVLDSGTDIDHEDLAGNVWRNDGEIPDNGVDDDGNGYIDDWEGWDFHNMNNEPRPVFYHGTHVTGIINAVGDNGIGITGLAGGLGGNPGVLGMALRVGADQRDDLVAQVAGHPHRAEFRVLDVGAAPRVRGRPFRFDQGDQLVVLGVDHRHLVARVGGNQEIAASRIETAVVQEALGLDRGHREVLDVLVIDHEDVAGLLNVDDEFGTVM